jgi:hypothetical protein
VPVRRDGLVPSVGAPIAVLISLTKLSTRCWNAWLTPIIRFATTSSSTLPILLLAPRVAATVAPAAFTSALEPLSRTPAPTATAMAGHG